MSIDKALLDQLMAGREPGDLFGQNGILTKLTKALAERALNTELDIHLDEERATKPDDGASRPGNRRNGTSQKTVTTDSGKVILNDLRNRGVQDILIAVVDGLKGFLQAIEAAFPRTQIQTCVVHLLRHSMGFAGYKDRDLLPIGPSGEMGVLGDW